MRMSTDRRGMIAKKACSRCRIHKRRCDRVMPECGLCTRLGQECEYKTHPISSSGLGSSPSSNSEILPGPGAFTQSHLREAIIKRLGFLTLECILSSYSRAVEPWFPIVSISCLRSRLPGSGEWAEASLDVALLSLSIILITTPPPPSSEDKNGLSEFKNLYLSAKSAIASAEGLGINSFLMVQSRVLVTLFEVAHGFYPAAYISSGATIRSADALEVMQLGADSLPSHCFDGGIKQEETVLAWCGILILDRFIAIESGPRPSVARASSQVFQDALKQAVRATLEHNPDHSSPVYRFSRLFEASALPDAIYTSISSPNQDFNREELLSTVQTVMNLQSILNFEIGDGIRLYAGALDFCNIALLIAFENGSKIPIIPGENENCSALAKPSLESILSITTRTAETFTLGTQAVDLNCIPPFVTYLVYRAAAILTERLLLGGPSVEELRKLRVLRTFLKLMGDRWLGYERYLKVLDEDTTPRIRKQLDRDDRGPDLVS